MGFNFKAALAALLAKVAPRLLGDKTAPPITTGNVVPTVVDVALNTPAAPKEKKNPQ